MSDEYIRALERRYRAGGDAADGEAWVQAVLRTTGANLTFLIARTIESQRVMHAIMSTDPYSEMNIIGVVSAAMARTVAPEDIVDFMRGGRNWLSSPTPPQTSTLVQDLVALGMIDPNAHLPHQRGVPRGDAILCNHANENPGHCPCDPDCYCRQDGHTCSDVSREY